MYTPAFRRLGGVTQVVAPFEGQVVHNRLTHSLEVAQIARRLAEKLVLEDEAGAKRWGDIVPDVAEAAALAHDLGHPPFGHAAETELDALAYDAGDPDGFEGNAQSFRIVTRLAPHARKYDGLDLTRATLNALLKYPWPRSARDIDAKKHNKFGAYRDDMDAFDFAREGSPADRSSVEAEIMDIADDIAYAVHDLDDFFRAGLIPVDTLRAGAAATDGPVDRIFTAWEQRKTAKYGNAVPYQDSIRRLLSSLPVETPYSGAFAERQTLQWVTSRLIGDFIDAVSLADNADADRALVIDPPRRAQIYFLQELVWYYVISNPRLAAQRSRQETIIRDLFGIYREAIEREQLVLLPPVFREYPRQLNRASVTYPNAVIRLTVDVVASLGDVQATRIHQRLTSTALQSASDLVDG